MRARPELVRGDGAPGTELMRLGRLIAKGGAEGMLCAARDGLGSSLKAEDGDSVGRSGARGVPDASLDPGGLGEGARELARRGRRRGARHQLGTTR